MKKNAAKNRKKRRSGGEQCPNGTATNSAQPIVISNGHAGDSSESSLNNDNRSVKIINPSSATSENSSGKDQIRSVNGITKRQTNGTADTIIVEKNSSEISNNHQGSDSIKSNQNPSTQDPSIKKLMNRLDNCLNLLPPAPDLNTKSSKKPKTENSCKPTTVGKTENSPPDSTSEKPGSEKTEKSATKPSSNSKNSSSEKSVNPQSSKQHQQNEESLSATLQKLKIISDTTEKLDRTGGSSRKIEFAPNPENANRIRSSNIPPEFLPDDTSSDDPTEDSELNQYYQDFCSANLERILASRRERSAANPNLPGTSAALHEDSASMSDESRNSFHTAHGSPSKTQNSTFEDTILSPMMNAPRSVDQLITDIKKRLKLNLTEEESFDVQIVPYEGESQLPDIMRLVSQSLSEPYTIYTYRYFLHNWPNLCFMAQHKDGTYVGTIVCKLDRNRHLLRRGYIAMLTVDETYKRQKIGSRLVKTALSAMIEKGCDEVVLETEVTNNAALGLYENLGFIKDKRLFRYYLNGVDAFRLKLRLISQLQHPMFLHQNPSSMFG